MRVLARDEVGALVSHAAWATRWLQPAALPLLRTAYVEAAATAPAQQGRGLANEVLRHLSDMLRTDPSWALAALSPSDPVFHARTPATLGRTALLTAEWRVGELW